MRRPERRRPETAGTKPAAGCLIPMRQRSRARLVTKVIHRHRVGSFEFRRVSELVFIRGTPKAILGWVDVAGVLTPIYLCDLDPAKLRRSPVSRDTWYYDATTVDPRYEDLAAAVRPAAGRG